MLLAAGASTRTQYAPAVRAQQLADVALAVYEKGGLGIHVPLDSSHALVAVLKTALEREAKERPGKHWQVCVSACFQACTDYLPDCHPPERADSYLWRGSLDVIIMGSSWVSSSKHSFMSESAARSALG